MSTDHLVHEFLAGGWAEYEGKSSRDGPICPHCGLLCSRAVLIPNGVGKCPSCRRDFMWRLNELHGRELWTTFNPVPRITKLAGEVQ